MDSQDLQRDLRPDPKKAWDFLARGSEGKAVPKISASPCERRPDFESKIT
jgi:hypothetical protein